MSDAPLSRPCPDCASPVRAADQSFCDSCGAFLRWDAPAAATPSAATPEAAPDREEPTAPTAAATPTAPPAPEAPEAPDAPDAPESRPAAGSEEVTAPLPAVDPSREAPAPAPVPQARLASDEASDTAVRSLLVPVPGNRPTEPAVAAPVLPARPEAARPAA
ncbi:hypothetical protein AB0B13_38055, partial [Streptomyces sp. NPDC042898]